MITIHSVAIAAVAGTLMGGASTAIYLKSDDGVPLNRISRSAVQSAPAPGVTALKQDEGVPRNLVTGLKEDAGSRWEQISARRTPSEMVAASDFDK